MIVVVAREVIGDRNRLQHPRIADQLGELVALVGPVQSGGDQNQNALCSDAGIEQRAHDLRQQQAHWAPGA